MSLRDVKSSFARGRWNCGPMRMKKTTVADNNDERCEHAVAGESRGNGGGGGGASASEATPCGVAQRRRAAAAGPVRPLRSDLMP